MEATMINMTRWFFRHGARALLALSVALGSAPAGAVPYSATLLPADGIVSGAPGTTVGWGYAVSNPDMALWLVFTGLSADTFFHGTPDALFDLPIVAPDSSLTTPYDGMNGLFAFTWDSDTPEGFLNTGLFGLHAQWWDGDPLAGGSVVADADDIVLAYAALATSSGPVPVPEPSTALLVLLGVGALAHRRRSGRRQHLQNGTGRRADVEHV
jgi:hypothetical protein